MLPNERAELWFQRPSNPNLPDSILPHQLDLGGTEDVTRAPHFHEAKVKEHRGFGCEQLEV